MNLRIINNQDGSRSLVDVSGKQSLIDGPGELVQKLSGFLNNDQGEWSLDQTFFLPWISQVFVKNPDLPTIETIMKAGISSRNGVQRLLSYEQDWNQSLRDLQIRFTVLTESNESVEIAIQGNPEGSAMGMFALFLFDDGC